MNKRGAHHAVIKGRADKVEHSDAADLAWLAEQRLAHCCRIAARHRLASRYPWRQASGKAGIANHRRTVRLAQPKTAQTRNCCRSSRRHPVRSGPNRLPAHAAVRTAASRAALLDTGPSSATVKNDEWQSWAATLTVNFAKQYRTKRHRVRAFGKGRNSGPISSRMAGSSMVVGTLQASPAAILRSTARRILPERVLGNRRTGTT